MVAETGLSPIPMHLSQRPVQLQLLLSQHGQFGKVAAALGFGDQHAQFALAALDGAFLNLLDRALYLALRGRLGLRQQRLSQQSPLRLILDYIHRVASLPCGKRLHGLK